MTTNSLSYSDLPGLVRTATHEIATIVEHELMAKNTWRMRLACPEIARQIIPGQFFMIRSPGRTDPLLGRPFALFDLYDDEDGQPAGFDFGYVVVGKMTSLLESLTVGDALEIWGPLGNGFPLPKAGHLVIAAGGIGQTPFLAVIREALGRRQYGTSGRVPTHHPSKITMCYGVRNAEYLAGLKEFQGESIDFRISTDDGSAGHKGFVTDLLKSVLNEGDSPTALYCCGPEPLMRAVRQIAIEARVPAHLSLETPMACGFGACFSCVTKIRQDDGTWDYRRVCVEGPVFPAEQVVFD